MSYPGTTPRWEVADVPGEPVHPAVESYVKDVLARREAELRRLLEMWVSELEPIVVYAHPGGAFLGLGAVGQYAWPEHGHNVDSLLVLRSTVA